MPDLFNKNEDTILPMEGQVMCVVPQCRICNDLPIAGGFVFVSAEHQNISRQEAPNSVCVCERSISRKSEDLDALGSREATLATKCTFRGGQSSTPATNSALRGSPIAAPATKLH